MSPIAVAVATTLEASSVWLKSGAAQREDPAFHKSHGPLCSVLGLPVVTETSFSKPTRKQNKDFTRCRWVSGSRVTYKIQMQKWDSASERAWNQKLKYFRTSVCLISSSGGFLSHLCRPAFPVRHFMRQDISRGSQVYMVWTQPHIPTDSWSLEGPNPSS